VKRTRLDLHDEQIALIIEHLEIDFDIFYTQKSDGNTHYFDVKWVVNDVKKQMPDKFFQTWGIDKKLLETKPQDENLTYE
tara:strand:- start:366 stop:605 length:240 start_codon:yes stop_codon:yes gene_type:complete